MLKIIEQLYDRYNNGLDPRQDGFFLVRNPVNMLLLLVLYWFMATKGAKYLMKNQKPFELKRILIVYNLVQIILNGWFAYLMISWALNYDKYTLTCLPIDYSTSENGLTELHFFQYTVLIKTFDTFDTLFLVLSKKPVSFLHVFHHSSMIYFSYIMSQFVPGGQAISHLCLNLIVHVFMYSYYFFTALNPEVKKSVWWKRNITHIQIIQFLLSDYYAFRTWLTPNCTYPTNWLYLIMFEGTSLLVLFSNFYYRTYIRAKTKKTQ